MVRRAFLLALAAAAACGGDDEARPDAGEIDAAMPDAAATDASLTPMTLGETGLYADELGGELAPGVLEYRVAWELWSDGAAKRRFVFLPEGAVIDTSDMDFWRYPVGTKIWKEFSVGGARIETRLLWKQAEGEWLALAFAWNEDGTEAIAAPDGIEDALGTSHDIPRERDCLTCHDPQPDMVLGLSALQLDHAPGEVTLASLVAGGRLSDPPEGEAAPHFPLPGDEVDRAALGVLHGNCGGCHFAGSDVQEQTSLELRLAVADLGAVESTTVYRTAVDQEEDRALGPPVTALIEPGDHEASAVWVRMGSRVDMEGMPPLGSEVVDQEGLAAVAAWIDRLPPTP